MRSDDRDHRRLLPPPAPAIADFAAPTTVPPLTEVWVLLDELAGTDLAKPRTLGDGLEMTGRARGLLREWRRGSRGEWFGMVNYQVHYADGRPKPALFFEQFVPAEALLPRADRVPLGGDTP